MEPDPSVSAACHDLRTPIAAILLHAELAMAADASSEDQARAVAVAHRQATRLANLLNDLEANLAHYRP